MQVKTDATNVVTPLMWRDFDVQPVDTNVRICHKFGHFSSLCYKKKSQNKRESRKPRAHQLMVGRASVQDLLCDQSDGSFKFK